MRRQICILLVLTWILWGTDQSVANARDSSEDIESIQKQLKQQQMTIQELKHEIRGIKENRDSIPSSQTGKEGVTKEDLDLLWEELGAIQEEELTSFKTLSKQVKLNFYATLEYENFQNTNSEFDARNIELLLDVKPHSRLRGFAEIEFERTAKTSTGTRQGEVEVEQGWIEYQINSYINPRAGVILAPFGRFNLEHFDPMQDLTARPIMARRVVPTTWAEAGAGLAGSIPLGDFYSDEWLEDFELNYQVYIVNGLNNEISDTSLRNARGAFGNDANNNKALVGRVQISPISAIQLGVSGYTGKYDDNNKIKAYDLDVKFVYNAFEMVGEFADFDLDGGMNNNSQAITEDLQGGYLEGRYHFWPDFLNQTFLGQGFDAPTFTALARAGYAEIGDDGDAGTGDNREKRLTLGLNYRPVENLAFKLEYQFNTATNESLERGDKNGFLTSISAAF